MADADRFRRWGVACSLQGAPAGVTRAVLAVLWAVLLGALLAAPAVAATTTGGKAATPAAGTTAATGGGAAKGKALARVAARQAGFYVQINPRKDSGHAWHGPGDLFVLGGKMVTHLPEAPGAVLCLVTLEGTASCPGQRGGAAVDEPAPQPAPALGKSASSPLGKLLKLRGKKPQSPCPSSYNCEFEDVALPDDDIFGVVVIDPAMAFINLVDAVIVTRHMRTKKDPEVAAFDERLREAVNRLAPPGPFESKRRLRKFEVRTLDECGKGCKFSQSELTIDVD